MSSPGSPILDDIPQYAGFWPRIAANLLDGVIWLIPTMPTVLLTIRFPRYPIYAVVPNAALSLFYSVYLVYRFGGTPGKLMMGLQVRSADLAPVSLRQAFMRHVVDVTLTILLGIGVIIASFHISAEEFAALSWFERVRELGLYSPGWAGPVSYMSRFWSLEEPIVLLTNSRRRALHDFIAGTVVVLHD